MWVGWAGERPKIRTSPDPAGVWARRDLPHPAPAAPGAGGAGQAQPGFQTELTQLLPGTFLSHPSRAQLPPSPFPEPAPPSQRKHPGDLFLAGTPKSRARAPAWPGRPGSVCSGCGLGSSWAALGKAELDTGQLRPPAQPRPGSARGTAREGKTLQKRSAPGSLCWEAEQEGRGGEW